MNTYSPIISDEPREASWTTGQWRDVIRMATGASWKGARPELDCVCKGMGGEKDEGKSVVKACVENEP